MKFTTEQLDKDLEEIDASLRVEKIPIPGRSLRAICDFSKKHKIGLPISEPLPGTHHESYKFWPITEFIKTWFDERYGERQGMDMGPGKCVFLLRGDPWIFHYPKFFGHHKFVLSRDFASKDLAPIDGIGAYNIFEAIKNFPIGLRKSTTNDELQYLLDTFCFGYSALTTLEEQNNNELINTATADLDAAVSHIMSSRSEPSLSKWSSLQATEKFLKYVIQSKNQGFQKTHNLKKLSNSLISLGVNIDISSEISAIQCGPGIRYGEEKAEVKDAVEAYHAALFIVYKLKDEIL